MQEKVYKKVSDLQVKTLQDKSDFLKKNCYSLSTIYLLMDPLNHQLFQIKIYFHNYHL